MKLVALAVVVGMLGGSQRETEACSPAPPCPEYNLEYETPPEPLTKALAAAEADDATKLKALGTSLRSAEFLKLLGTDAEAARCVVKPILERLVRNPNARARTEFLSLLTAKAWQEQPDEVDGAELNQALLWATAKLSRPPAQLVSFWKAHAKPDDGWVNVTTMVLIENGSPAALKLFSQLVAGNTHDVDTRIGWFHSAYAPHRTEPAVMAMATKLLAGKLPKYLREAIIDASMGPSQVRSTCPENVPPVDGYNAAARKGLRKLIAAANKSEVDEYYQHVLEQTLAELDKRDQMPVLDD